MIRKHFETLRRARAPDGRGASAVPSPSRNYLLGMLAEFRRAAAAAQRYEDLRSRSAWHGRIAPADIPRQVFEEFYSFEEAVESRRPGGAGWMLSAFAGAMGVMRRIVLRIAAHEPRKT